MSYLACFLYLQKGVDFKSFVPRKAAIKGLLCGLMSYEMQKGLYYHYSQYGSSYLLSYFLA